MNTFKKRLAVNAKERHHLSQVPKEINDSLEVKKQKRDQLCFHTGQHQYKKAIIEAELLQYNQEILKLSNEIAKEEQDQKGSPVKAAPEPEIVPKDV